MGEVSKISANGIDYDVKDEVARNGISSANANIATLQESVGTAQNDIATANANIATLQTRVSALDYLHVVPLRTIGYTSGESVAAKIERAVANGYIPVGEPFIGAFSSGSRYFTAGYLYSTGSGTYGFVLAGSPDGFYVCKVSAGTYTVTKLA